MLKTIARAIEFNEKSISKKKLRYILILLIASLPTLPLGLLHFYEVLPDNLLGKLGHIGFIVGGLSFFAFIFTRFANRFYFPDKYLDEWEVRIKHKSMTFAFMVMIWVMPLLLLIILGLRDSVFDMTSDAMLVWSCGIIVVLMYIQTFHALWQVRPIDEE